MSHLYIEYLCPSALVLTLGPLTCRSLQGPKSAATHTPTDIKLQSLLSVECRICRGLHWLEQGPPVLWFWPFLQPRKALPSFPQGETLPHDCHQLAQFLPCSGISRQLPGHWCGPLVALSGITGKSQLATIPSSNSTLTNSLNVTAW